MFRAWICVGIVALTATLARADEVQFVNGDKLTGKVVSVDADKMTFEGPAIGKITIEMAQVKTFSTDGPIAIKLKDGTVLNQKANAAEAGKIATEGGAVAKNTLAFADIKAINPPPQKWDGSVVVGGTANRGNTDNESLDIRIAAAERREIDRITLGAGYSFSREKSSATGLKTTSADNWFAEGKYDYFFNPKWYAFGKGRVERDRIANIDYRIQPSVGIGYQWVETPDFNFNTEAGLAYNVEQYANSMGSDNFFAARFAYHLDKKINDKVKLFHNLEYLPSLENFSDFNLNTDAGIRASLTAKMFTEFKVEWKYDSEPAPGSDKHDLRFVLGVGWQF